MYFGWNLNPLAIVAFLFIMDFYNCYKDTVHLSDLGLK
jgi:hypothetical protein